jgi:hypothetical protein
MITVKDLIAFLQTQEQDLPVGYRCCSEQILLDIKDIEVIEACYPRPDGWIQYKRPDMESQKYLLFPGN